MARPKTGNKHEAILNAAADALAEQGPGASTASISKRAGVAEGTLFTYFPTKDDLFLALFFELKREAYASIEPDFPVQAQPKMQARHFFDRYVDWGVAHPHKRHALAHLVLSDKISDAAKVQADEASAGYVAVLKDRLAAGPLQHGHPDFGTAVMHGIAEATMEFMTRCPEEAEDYRNAGFEAFWRAIGK